MPLLIDSDKRGKTLCGLPLLFKEVPIEPIRVKDVIIVGENKYNYYLMLVISLQKVFENVTEDLKQHDIDKLSNFEILLILMVAHPNFGNEICNALSFFFGNKEVKFDQKKNCFVLYNSEEETALEIHEKDYDELVDLIRFQNYSQEVKEVTKRSKPAGKKARELLEQREKAKTKLAKAKRSKGEPLDFADYISIVNSKSLNMDIDKCLNMTVFAFFDYLERLALIDSYEVGIQQLLAGAKPDKVNLKHWFSQLQ